VIDAGSTALAAAQSAAPAADRVQV
jgi:hypothetical protein